MRETKTFPFQVKATGVTTSSDGQELGHIEAYGSVFDVIDEGDGYLQDIVRKGAFTRTIKNSKARIDAGKANFLATMLWSHDPQNHLPIGGWSELKEDTNGLLGKGQIVLATQLGREVYELIKAGVVTQFSIGYDVPKDGSHVDHKAGIRELTEIRLWEISPCVFAMNQEALLVSVKSQDDPEPPTPPRPADDGKARSRMNRKDFHDNYRPRQIRDWKSELYSLVSSFCETCDDAFKEGDEPLTDIMDALNGNDDSPGFIAEVQKWVEEGVEIDYSNYLTEMQSSSPYSYYDYMSNQNEREQKAGRTVSAATAGTIQSHADSLHDLADKALSTMKEHTKAIRTVADDLATFVLQGSEAATTTDPGDAGDRTEGKATSLPSVTRRPPSENSSQDTTATKPRSSQDTFSEQDLTTALDALHTLRKTTTIVA